MIAYLGIDDGNFDTKSANTISPNGYSVHNALPPMVKDYLKYDGKYYVASKERFNYMEDKTASIRGLILSLFGIGTELISRAEKKKNEDTSVQDYITNINQIVLGVGLPPLHWKKHKEKEQYYYDTMKDGITFEYCGYHFSFKLLFCSVFPQDYATIVTNAKDKWISENPVVFGADIGGGTFDIIKVENGRPIMTQCDTSNSGILWMHKQIAVTVKLEHNITIKPTDIESVLRGQKTLLPEEVQATIRNTTQAWVDEQIVGAIIQAGINVDTEVVVFLGGGSLLLKPFIMKNQTIKHKHFLSERAAVHGNAIGYEILVKQLYKAALKK